MRNRTGSIGILLLGAVWAAPLSAQEVAAAGDGPFMPKAATELQWAPVTPPGFDEGMELTVVSGDPSKAGEPYVVRLRFPDGYRFPPHFHPVAENLTVLEGTFLLAPGEEADEAELVRYRPGDYMHIEARHPHFGGAAGATVIQLHGSGPFEIVVVGSPEDDGRRATRKPASAGTARDH